MELRKIHRGGEKRASYVLTLPQDYLEALDLTEGDYVSLSLQDGGIMVVPVQEIRRREEASTAPSQARQALPAQKDVPGK